MECPSGFICFNSQTAGLIMGIAVITVLYAVSSKKSDIAVDTASKDLLEKRISHLERERSTTYIRDVSPSYRPDIRMERIYNPLLPPEKSYDLTARNAINIPTRGETPSYQQVGSLTDEDSRVLPLYGRPTWRGSNKWNYYTNTDGFHTTKLPVQAKSRNCLDDNGCDELYDDDNISIPQYGGKNFRVNVYPYDKPRYL